MTSAQRILFGAVASLLLMVGLVKVAESFDPIVPRDRPNDATAGEFGASSLAHWT